MLDGGSSPGSCTSFNIRVVLRGVLFTGSLSIGAQVNKAGRNEKVDLVGKKTFTFRSQ